MFSRKKALCNTIGAKAVMSLYEFRRDSENIINAVYCCVIMPRYPYAIVFFENYDNHMHMRRKENGEKITSREKRNQRRRCRR